jgi:hypothetical protein
LLLKHLGMVCQVSTKRWPRALLRSTSSLDGTTRTTPLPITSCVTVHYYLVITLTGHHKVVMIFVKGIQTLNSREQAYISKAFIIWCGKLYFSLYLLNLELRLVTHTNWALDSNNIWSTIQLQIHTSTHHHTLTWSS